MNYSCELCGVDTKHIHLLAVHCQGVDTTLEICDACYKENRGA